MVRQFPEIESFFTQDVFTENDILELKAELVKKYTDMSVYKKAITLIDLFLVKFDLSTPEELKEFKLNKFSSRTKRTRIKNGIKAVPSKNKESKRVNAEKVLKIELESFKNMPVTNFYDKIKLSINLMNTILEQKNLSEIKDDVLSDEQYDALKHIIKSKIEAKNREIKSEIKLNMVKSSHIKDKQKYSSGVYSKIAARGGLGKIIYIRSK
jgi:hypothetical protein